jgi:hypothetical protein
MRVKCIHRWRLARSCSGVSVAGIPGLPSSLVAMALLLSGAIRYAQRYRHFGADTTES